MPKRNSILSPSILGSEDNEKLTVRFRNLLGQVKYKQVEMLKKCKITSLGSEIY